VDAKSTKLWGGRFEKETDRKVEEFNASLPFDRRLYREDIAGSVAHARMLARQGIIPLEDASSIVAGLREILAEMESGTFEFDPSLEDIHMAVETRLTQMIGSSAGKLHTARSRNDQVALDFRLFARQAVVELVAGLAALQETLLKLAEEHSSAIMPGYTHTQRAQPVLFAHYMLAYFEMLQRDVERFQEAQGRINVLPLGSGALAGVPYPIDRELVAAELGFAAVSANSLDAVSDRDFVVELLSDASLTMAHLSRLAQEIVQWSTAEFAFVELDDAYATGSSIMPQKKNPDVAELVRGKTGRVFGHLIGMLTVLKGLPLAYNSDLQEDKEALFDAVDTLGRVLAVFAPLLASLKINEERLRQAAGENFSLATDVADYLSKKGLPFRQAHEVVGRLVRFCLEQQTDLAGLTLEQYREFSPLFEPDILDLSVDTSVAARDVPGGTAPKRVKTAQAAAAQRVATTRDWLRQKHEAFSLDLREA
jgi:argininosuccinate lyase